jgi:hypothetical protein
LRDGGGVPNHNKTDSADVTVWPDGAPPFAPWEEMLGRLQQPRDLHSRPFAPARGGKRRGPQLRRPMHPSNCTIRSLRSGSGCARRNLPSELSGSQRTGASSNIASARSTRQWFSVPRQPDEKTNEPAARHDQIEACPAHQVAALNWLYSLGSIRHAVVLLERILGTKAGSIRLN